PSARTESSILRRGRRCAHSTEGRVWRTIAMTETELLTTAARAWSIWAALRVHGGEQRHHFGWCAPLLQELRHCLHRGFCMVEKQIQPLTHVVMSGFSVARQYKPVLWTTSVAQWPHIAIPALRSQRVPLVIPEPALLRRTHKL